MLKSILPNTAAFAIITLCTAGALTPNQARAQFLNNPGPGIQWSAVNSGTAPNPKGPVTMVMYTEGQYEMFWHILYGLGNVPPVNIPWGKEFLIGICAGPQAAGTALHLQTIAKVNPSTASAQWALNSSNPYQGGQGSQGNAVLSGAPWEIDAVQAFGGRITFQQVSAPTFRNGTFFTNNCFNYPPIVITSYYGPYSYLPYEVIDYGAYAAVSNFGYYVIGNQTQFTQYLSNTYGPNFNAPTAINWNQTMFVGITLGKCPTTGYSIKVLGLKKVSNGKYKLLYEVIAPPKGAIEAQVVTCPHVLVRVPKVDGTIDFQKVVKSSGNPPSSGISGQGPTVR